MRFDHLDPADTNPWHFVDRDDDRKTLRESLERYLTEVGTRKGRTWAVIGDKGIGKSIFTRAVLSEIQADFDQEVLIVTVDCRGESNWKKVLRKMAWKVVEDLDRLRQANYPISDELLSTARVVDTIARFDEAELKQIHEHIQAFEIATNLKGSKKLLSTLDLSFGINLKRSSRDIRGLTGKILIDEQRLSEALCALFEDIRNAGLGAIVYLDNIDELDHDYSTDSAIERVKRDVEGLLDFNRAPVAFILNMRTYFSRVLRRNTFEIIRLEALDVGTLVEILEKRAELEKDDLKAWFATPEIQKAVKEIARRASTPLSFLVWIKFMSQRGFVDTLDFTQGQRALFRTRISTVPHTDIEDTIATFGSPDAVLARADLLEACGGSEELFQELEELQIVLPLDFWSPTRFTLSPELQFAHPSWAHSS